MKTPFNLAAACLLLLSTFVAQAQRDDAQLREALTAAARGQPVTAQMRTHPAHGWIEFAGIRRDLANLPIGQADDFLARHRDQPVVDAFLQEWIGALYRRQEWAAIDAAWSDRITGTALRCMALDARHRLGRADAQWERDVQAIWLGSGQSLPDECDAPFAALDARGALTPDLRWQRLERAAEEWQPAVMRAIARGLPAEQAALAADYAAFVEAPHARALDWPRDTRSRTIASHGLARLGRNDPDAAEAQLPRYDTALQFGEEERGRVLHQIALWTVASYNPGAARRLNLVPESAYDERLHEWRAREGITRSDWNAALAAIAKMGDAQRNSSRWTYFSARLNELLGNHELAQTQYRQAATDATFHGFLAADRLDQPYALCPWLLRPDMSSRARVANDPGIIRAMALYRADRPGWATREWTAALERFDDSQRHIAVLIAQENGWFDRGLFGLGRSPEEIRLYELRFPLTHEGLIRQHAGQHQIDPAWIAAEIRAESTFNPRARSSADARGLMQILPATGAAVARRLGVAWRGGDSLYDPATNIQLGTAYLREMKDRYTHPYVAIAAYNAGPTPTSRWRDQRPAMDADFWIETITYRETREYVARVLAFSVIYDWRLGQSAVPVTDRMHGRLDVARKPFHCPDA